MTKDEKIFQKFKKKYSVIFDDANLNQQIQNHFDQNGAFVGFCLAILSNKLDQDKLINHLKINCEEWVNLFSLLYKNNQIVNLYKKLEMNPIIPLEHIIESFSCFDEFINKFIWFLKQSEINLNIAEEELKDLIKNGLGYLLYNKVDCKLPYEIDKILLDNDYETKKIVILNNTKLFAAVKKSIVDNYFDGINDFIVLILGMNKGLSLDK